MNEMWSRCREARQQTGLTQGALAAELGLTTGAISQWEMRNGTTPSVPNMILLARRSGMSFEYLATGRGRKFVGPAVAEEPAQYRVEVQSGQEAELLRYFRPLRASKRAALLELVKPER